MATRKKVIIAPQETTDQFDKEIDTLLHALDVNGALVTDQSQFLDFISQFDYPTLADAQRRLDQALQDVGVTVAIDVRSTLAAACIKIVAEQPEWITGKPPVH